MGRKQIVAGSVLVCLGILVLVSLISRGLLGNSAGPSQPCGGDMPPCRSSTEQVVTALSSFTPPGCSMSGGIVSCTGVSPSNTSSGTLGVVLQIFSGVAIVAGVVLLFKTRKRPS